MAYLYEVYGMGEFPVDMLRYDQATIISSEDELDGSIKGYRTVYTIESKRKPTIGRWNSFMWHVHDVRRVK